MKPRRPGFLTPRRKYEVNESMKLVQVGRPYVERVVRGANKFMLFVQWGRVPKEWELSFVLKMMTMESQGISFYEVLKTKLPMLVGEAPSEILLNWIGREARHQPKKFAKTASSMFGTSARSIITGLEKLADPEEILESHRPVEPPFQSLIEAIQKADMIAEAQAEMNSQTRREMRKEL